MTKATRVSQKPSDQCVSLQIGGERESERTWSGPGVSIDVVQLVDLVLEVGEEGNVDGEGNERESGGQEGYEGGKQRDRDVRGERQRERNEGHSSCCERIVSLWLHGSSCMGCSPTGWIARPRVQEAPMSTVSVLSEFWRKTE